MIPAAGAGQARVYWRPMGTWALVRFLHVAAAATWLGMQVALFVLVPALRRMLPPERVSEVVRAAGIRLAIVAAIALLVAMVVLLAGHGLVPGRSARIAASALVLAFTLAAVYAGAWLAAR